MRPLNLRWNRERHRFCGAVLSVSKKGVIASQCAHWRGNLPDFRTFSVCKSAFYALFRRSPHQSEDWFAMTYLFLGLSTVWERHRFCGAVLIFCGRCRADGCCGPAAPAFRRWTGGIGPRLRIPPPAGRSRPGPRPAPGCRLRRRWSDDRRGIP